MSGADTMKPTNTNGFDWSRVDAMTDEEVEVAALNDPDAQPLTPEGLSRLRQTPRIKIIRRALGLSQEEFSARYRIPIGTLRDWEQMRSAPDHAARAYLAVIAHSPDLVREVLAASKPMEPRQ